MSELAERSKKLAKELVGNVQFYETQEMAFAPGIAAGWPEVIAAPHSKNGRLKRVQTESLTSRIEQALLAERRLAMEFAIQVVSDGDLTYRHKMVERLRAAAEKEVGK